MKSGDEVWRFDNVKGAHALIHNPGYEFRDLVILMAKANPNDRSYPFSSYFLPVISLVAACFSIEGYINMVGQQIDSDWQSFDKGRVGIKDKLKKIYCIICKPIDFGQGIWQEVLELFKNRNDFVHPKYINRKEVRNNEIPTIFQVVEDKYPCVRIKEIMCNAISTLLNDTNINDVFEDREYFDGPVIV